MTTGQKKQPVKRRKATPRKRLGRTTRKLKPRNFASVALWIAFGLSAVMLAMAGNVWWVSHSSLRTGGIGASIAAIAENFAPETAGDLISFMATRPMDLPPIQNRKARVPRIAITALPADLATLPTPQMRKVVFLQTMIPLALMVNEELILIRVRILALEKRHLAGLSLSTAQRNWLASTAARFGASWKQDKQSPTKLFPELLKRADAVPVSLILGQASIESGWGTARVAIEGNAIFGQRIWAREDAVDASNGTTTLYRAYPNLHESTRAYVMNLNRHPAYAPFRQRRGELRATGRELDSAILAGGLLKYSERGQAYIDQVRTVIAANRLTDFDKARLVNH